MSEWIRDGEGNPVEMKSERFKCWGHYEPWDGHGLRLIQGVDIEHEGDKGMDDLVWMTFWYSGYHRCTASCPQCDGVWDRLRNAFRLLRGKPVSADEFVFDLDEAKRMAHFILSLDSSQLEKENR